MIHIGRNLLYILILYQNHNIDYIYNISKNYHKLKKKTKGSKNCKIIKE